MKYYHKNLKVSAEKNAHENIEYEYNKKNSIRSTIWVLKKKRKNLNDVIVRFNANLKKQMVLKNGMVWCVYVITKKRKCMNVTNYMM